MTEFLLYGLREGETERYMEELLAVRPSREMAKTVIEFARRDGWHSFRIAEYNGEAPDFARAMCVPGKFKGGLK